MKTVRRYLYASIFSAVSFVAAVFLSLFFFLDFVDELTDIGNHGYSLSDALWVCTLQLPSHLYELMPIAVLIGAIYAFSRMAQSSEFTIFRTSGLSPKTALFLLGSVGLLFSLITILVGDIAAPFAQRQATLIKAEFLGKIGLSQIGAWIKDIQIQKDGEHQISIHIGEALNDGHLRHIRIFEMNPAGEIISRISGEEAKVFSDKWEFKNVNVMQLKTNPSGSLFWASTQWPTWDWPTNLNTRIVSAATLPLNTMTTSAMFTYLKHLQANAQEARRYEIAFWQRALYPAACLVMLALALPFAYLHTRKGGVSVKVFGGIMLGISFVLLNHVSSHLGQLRHWIPWCAAALPSALYLLISMVAFGWLVRFR